MNINSIREYYNLSDPLSRYLLYRKLRCVMLPENATTAYKARSSMKHANTAPLSAQPEETSVTFRNAHIHRLYELSELLS